MKKTAVCITVTILVLLIAFGISVPIINNHSAKTIEVRLAQISLPENTEYIESVSAAGKLTGNGNGMQYFGAVLLNSGLSLEELEHSYAIYSENEWDCLVDIQEEQKIEMIENETLAFETSLSPDEQYYIVYSWGEGVSPFSELDIRGN